MTPFKVGEAVGAVVVAAGAAHSGGDARWPTPPDSTLGQPRSGLGEAHDADLVQALAYALQAEVDYALDADGVRCRIELPVS